MAEAATSVEKYEYIDFLSNTSTHLL